MTNTNSLQIGLRMALVAFGAMLLLGAAKPNKPVPRATAKPKAASSKKTTTPRSVELTQALTRLKNQTAAKPTTVPDASNAPSNPTLMPHIVIDPGHGGKDTGALTKNKVAEKEIALAIATRVAERLKTQGFRVTLTRTDDTSLTLNERTSRANELQADAFVSIHANASRKPTANGIETYYLDVTNDRYALKLAALENQTNEHEVSDLKLILADLATKVNTEQSLQLAQAVQSRLLKAARTRHKAVKNLGVKPSLFYVLLGARMPAILVETGFVTHKQESALLVEPNYQTTLADAIASAVAGHFRTVLARK